MRRFPIWLCMLMTSLTVMAQQDSFEEYRKHMLDGFKDHRAGVLSDYENYRQKINSEYAEQMRQIWSDFQVFKGVPQPKEEHVPPIEYKKDPIAEPRPGEEIPVEIQNLTVPSPEPQPQPVVPIELKISAAPVYFKTTFLGSEIKVRISEQEKFHLSTIGESQIADQWKVISNGAYDNLLYDCLELRKQLHLCDWAYLQMLVTISDSFLGAGSNESTLLLSWLYCQSGYMMRIGKCGNQLEMLFASKHTIYNQSYYKLNGMNFYPIHKNDKNLQIFNKEYESEQPLSLLVGAEQSLAVRPSNDRIISSRDYPQLSVHVQTNLNNLDFYSTYPASAIDGDMMTRWAMCANVPFSDMIKSQLYPAMKREIAKLSQLEAANHLLNWVQTGFTYEYDDVVWGHDRAFFAEETLFYPYCDCEDRSILFSRLVRDLLGLDVVLVYSPGHLSTAIAFTEEVQGDYLTYKGRRFVMCDPTYVGAPVGHKMPSTDMSQTRAILLK